MRVSPEAVSNREAATQQAVPDSAHFAFKMQPESASQEGSGEDDAFMQQILEGVFPESASDAWALGAEGNYCLFASIQRHRSLCCVS